MKSGKRRNVEELPVVNPEIAKAAAKAVNRAIDGGTVSDDGEQEKPVIYGDKVLTPAQMKKRTVLRWVLLLIGITMMSFSVYFFQKPNDITLGGIAGIAMILSSCNLTTAVIFFAIYKFLQSGYSGYTMKRFNIPSHLYKTVKRILSLFIPQFCVSEYTPLPRP